MMVLSGASLAIAGPLLQREPEVDVVVDVVTNVVTSLVEYTVYATTTSSTPPVVHTPEVHVVTVTVQPTTTTTPTAETPNVEVAPATTSSSSTSTSSTAAATSTATDFADVAVYHHNIHRANNSAPDVTYSDKLAGFALQLSQGCVFEHDVTIGVDSEFPSYGQNIAMYAATDIENLSINEFLAQSISDYWYNNEIELYPGPYGSEPDMADFEAWGHYSQVVWVGSTVIGCGIAKCAAGTLESGMDAYMSTCNYYPAGNVETEYAANVLAPLGEASVTA